MLPVKDKVPEPLKDESVFLKSLEGFLLVISSEGDFVYLSENVSDYLGITQVNIYFPILTSRVFVSIKWYVSEFIYGLIKKIWIFVILTGIF